MVHETSQNGFPKTLIEFEKQFRTNQACRAYLENTRWPRGFICPECGSEEAWRTNRQSFFCRSCKRQTSVTSGTIFHRSKIPLKVWFSAIWLLIGEKNGVSALGSKRQLGLKRYETAWRLLKKIRLATVRPGRELLRGEVELDETIIGGNKIPKGLSSQRAMVIIAAEVKGNGIGRIRMKLIRSRNSDSIENFIRQNIKAGSSVTTDGFVGYAALLSKNYAHKSIPGYSVHPDNLLPRIHRVASLLKRWLMGTYHGRVRKTHLDLYLEEFAFRFNRRNSESRGKLFQRLIEQSIQTGPETTYRGN